MFRTALLPAAALAAALSASPAAAAPDPTDFLFRLGMLQGHLMVGHELLATNHAQLALPHFGHPVRELYDDMADYIAAEHIAPFDTQLVKLEAAVVGAPTSPDTERQYQAVIATIDAARSHTPEALRASVPAMIKICSDTIDAAAGEYGEGITDGKIESLVEYHDSRGYVAYVAQYVTTLGAANKDAADQALIGRFDAVLKKAQYIVQPLIPAPKPRATVAQYRTIAAEAAALTPAATPAVVVAK